MPSSDLGILQPTGHVHPFDCPCLVCGSNDGAVGQHNIFSFLCNPLGNLIVHLSSTDYHSHCELSCLQVHPNPNRPSYLRLKIYEFAGRLVGKCLYESSLGGAYKQLVKARFTRSFLAQIIGLRMHYKVKQLLIFSFSFRK